MKNYAMRFISGKYQGGEFPLPETAEIIVGRSSDLDMVLVEDMVSRKHARIVVDGERITIHDLGSTNGTFVNGERVKTMELSDGDRVLIGTSIIKVVDAEHSSPSVTQQESSQRLQEVAEHRRGNQVRSMSGAIDDVPLPDLLQLFSSSRKTGTLVIKTDTDEGRVCLDTGKIVSASVNDDGILASEKAVYRILAWRHGSFYLEPAEEGELAREVELSAEAVLMEGMRIIDEVARHDLPAMTTAISVPKPLGAKLSDLTSEQLDVFQVAMHQPQLEAVFNRCDMDDVKIAASLKHLIVANYLDVAGG